MAAAPYIRTFIRQAIQSGLTQTGAERAFREAGGKIARQYWRGVWGEVQAQLALAPDELGKRLTSTPTESETHQLTSQRLRTGVVQEVKVIGRQRNGTIVTKDVPVFAGDTPMTRLRAIKVAEEWAAGFFAEESPVDTDIVHVYGGVYLGTARRVRAS